MKLRCRMLGHKWLQIGADEICKRCGCGKEEPVGEVVKEEKKATSLPDPPVLVSGAHKDIAVEDIVDLVDKKGLSHGEAAKVLDVSRQNISQLCKTYGIRHGGVEKYRKKELDLIDMVKAKHLYSLARGKPKGDKPKDDATIFGILYDKGALASGKPTAHVLYADVSRSQAQLKAEMEAMGWKVEDTEEGEEG